MSKIYEIVIFTASLSQYAQPLINQLDKDSVGFSQLYREHCTFYNNIYFVKDLSKLGRELKNIIFVDNSSSAYMFQPENAIPITSWYQNPHDKELYKLIPFLAKLADVEDVREFLTKPKLISFTPAPCSPRNGTDLFKSEDNKIINSSNSKRTLIQKKNNFLKPIENIDSKENNDKTDTSKPIQSIETEKEITKDNNFERFKTSRRKLRSSIKIDQETQNNEQKCLEDCGFRNKTSNNSQKRIKRKELNIVTDSILMSPIQTPKHSKANELKLFNQMKFIKTINIEKAPVSKMLRRRSMNKCKSQQSFIKRKQKTFASRKTSNQKSNIYLNSWQYANGKTLHSV